MAKMTFKEWWKNEKDEAISLANRILDTPAHDPDSMESVLSRQFLRATERIDALEHELSTLRETQKALQDDKIARVAQLEQIIKQQNEERLKINEENQRNYNSLCETQKAREAALIEKAAKEAYNVAAQCAYPADHDACDYFGCFDIQRVGDAIRAIKPDSALDDLLREARRQALESAGIVAGNTVTEEGRSEALAAIVRREIAALRAPLEPSNR